MRENSNKIKVAIVINDLNIGGAEKLVVDQLKYFNREKFDIALITLFDFPEQKDFFGEVPDDIAVYRMGFGGFKDLRSWFDLIKVLRKINPDMVVSHLFFSNTIVRVLKPIFRYKVITVEQNTYTSKTRLQISVDRILSNLSYKIVAVSKTVAKFTSEQECIPIDKFVVIHNAVDLEKIKETISELPEKDVLKEELGFSKNDKLLINVARLTPQKNQKLLIESFALFSRNHSEYKLIILGEGILRGELENLAKNLGVGNRVLLLGIKSPYQYYKISEFFCSTSYIEGLSVAYLEALTCGLPIIATKTAGTDECVENYRNGFIIEDISSIVDKMEKIIKSDMNMLGKEARKTAIRFDIRENVQQYELLIKNVFKNKAT